MKKIDVYALSDVELAYTFAQASGMAVLGGPKGPFAVTDTSQKTLSIFGGTAKKVFYSSFESDMSYVPLNAAQEYGATFRVETGQVICKVCNAIASGRTYPEAAMRALIQHMTSASHGTE